MLFLKDYLMNKYFSLVTFWFFMIATLSCEKAPPVSTVDNKISMTKEERIEKRWDDKIDSVSYAIGLDVAMRLNQQFDKFNYELINKAIKDYYTDSELFLTDKERVSVIKTYNEKLAPKFKMDLEKKNYSAGNSFLKNNKRRPGVIEHKSGIQYKIIKNSTGLKPKSTDIVNVHYIGRLIDGTKFDSSYDRGTPSSFPLNRIIPGWSQGIQLMSVGSIFEIYVPGMLAYAQGEGPGGPGATLIFEVELLGIARSTENKSPN